LKGSGSNDRPIDHPVPFVALLRLRHRRRDGGKQGMPSKNERVELEMQIMKYRNLARQIATDEETAARIGELIAELQKRLREIDE
jgi:hypothetical protein